MAPASTFLTLDEEGRATLPDEVREALGVGAGDFILLERTDRGTFELIPATLIPKDQLWFHHPEIQRRIVRAEEDFIAGRSTKTSSPEEAQAFLDQLKKKSRSRQAGTVFFVDIVSHDEIARYGKRPPKRG